MRIYARPVCFGQVQKLYKTRTKFLYFMIRIEFSTEKIWSDFTQNIFHKCFFPEYHNKNKSLN